MSVPRTGVLAGWLISIDLWGTLITYGDRDAEAAWRLREFATVLDEFGHQVPDGTLREVVTAARALTLQRQRMTGEQPTARAQVEAMLGALDIDDPQVAEVLVVPHTHAVLRACPEVIPGAHSALAEVKAAGARLTLTSNTLATPASVTLQLLDSLELTEPFDDLVFSSEIGIAKPRPEVFHSVAERADLEPGRVVHFGNDWRTDVLGALDAGCHALWFNPRGKPACPQAPAIARLDELPAALTSICTAPATSGRAEEEELPT